MDFLAAYKQRNDHVRVDHDIAQRQDTGIPELSMGSSTELIRSLSDTFFLTPIHFSHTLAVEPCNSTRLDPRYWSGLGLIMRRRSQLAAAASVARC